MLILLLREQQGSADRCGEVLPIWDERAEQRAPTEK
jgi:hypothetical protein